MGCSNGVRQIHRRESDERFVDYPFFIPPIVQSLSFLSIQFSTYEVSENNFSTNESFTKYLNRRRKLNFVNGEVQGLFEITFPFFLPLFRVEKCQGDRALPLVNSSTGIASFDVFDV